MRIGHNSSSSSISSVIDQFVETEVVDDDEISSTASQLDENILEDDLVPPRQRYSLYDDGGTSWSYYQRGNYSQDDSETELVTSNLESESESGLRLPPSPEETECSIVSEPMPGDFLSELDRGRFFSQYTELQVIQDPSSHFYNETIPVLDTMLEAQHVWNNMDEWDLTEDEKVKLGVYCRHLLPEVSSLADKAKEMVHEERQKLVVNGLKSGFTSMNVLYEKIHSEFEGKEAALFHAEQYVDPASEEKYTQYLRRESERLFVWMYFLGSLLFLRKNDYFKLDNMAEASQAASLSHEFFFLQQNVLRSVRKLFGEDFATVLTSSLKEI